MKIFLILLTTIFASYVSANENPTENTSDLSHTPSDVDTDNIIGRYSERNEDISPILGANGSGTWKYDPKIVGMKKCSEKN